MHTRRQFIQGLAACGAAAAAPAWVSELAAAAQASDWKGTIGLERHNNM
jgi:hypothetical protein